MVDRLVAVNDSDYRLPDPVLAALAVDYMPADEIVINVARASSIQAAIDTAPAGSRLYFPPSMSPVSVPSGGFVLKSNELTIDAMGVEFRVSNWGTPAFLALRANGGADGHTFRIGMVKYVGTRGNHTGTAIRGSAPYNSGCGVWSNGDRNYIQYLRTDGMPTPIFFASWDGSTAFDRMGVGNRVGYLEAYRYNFALLYVKQDAFDWGNAYCHSDLDDSSGTNPTHAIYCSADTGARAASGIIGNWYTVDNIKGAAYQIKYSDNVTFGNLVAERCGGLASFQNVDGVKGNILSGAQLSVAPTGARQVEFVGANFCERVNVGEINIESVAGVDSLGLSLFVNESLSIGNVSITSEHSGGINAASAEVELRGVGSNNIGQITIVAKGGVVKPVRMGNGTDAGRAAGWSIPKIRSLGNGAANDAIPVEELTHSHSNAWGDGGNFLSGAAPAKGIYRRGMRWAASAPASTQPKGWVQTSNGALSAATWVATTAVTAGVWWKLADGRVLRYLTAGTTGAAEPNPSTIGTTGSDGTATWEYMSATSGAVVSEGNL